MLIFVHSHYGDDYGGYMLNIREGEYQPFTSYLTYIVNYHGCSHMIDTPDIFTKYRIYGNTYKTGNEYDHMNVDKYIPIRNLLSIRDELITYQDMEDDWLTLKEIDMIKLEGHRDCIRIIRENGEYWDAYNTMPQVLGKDESLHGKALKRKKKEIYSQWKIPRDKEIFELCTYLFSILNQFNFNTEFKKFKNGIDTMNHNTEIARRMMEKTNKAHAGTPVPDYEARKELRYFQAIENQNV